MSGSASLEPLNQLVQSQMYIQLQNALLRLPLPERTTLALACPRG